MRILILNSEFPPLGGGAGNATFYLLKEFAKNSKIKIDLITSSTDKYKEENFSQNIKIYYLDIKKNGENFHFQSAKELLTYSFKAYNLAKKLKKTQDYDLIHAFFGIPCGYVAMKLKIPYIVSLRGSDVPFYNPRYTKIYPVLNKIIFKVWRKAQFVIANSQDLKIFSQKSKSDQKINIIPNGVDQEKFKPLNHQNKKIKLLFAGRFAKIKGLKYLLKAFYNFQKKYPDIELTLIGDGPLKKEFLDKYKNVDSIKFLPKLDQSELIKNYQKSDVFILPSIQEGMSNCLLEAMASGLAIITTNTGGAKKLISDNGIIIKKKDSKDIYKALKKLYQNPKLLSEMKKNSRKKALKMSWEKVANDYFNVYESMNKEFKNSDTLKNKGLKKICFIAPKAYQLFNPKIKSTFGGAEVQLHFLAKELAKNKNLDINFMTADYGQKKLETYENVKVWKSLDFKTNILKQIWTFFKVFRKINADVYVQRTLTIFSGIISLYCKIFGKKFVYMVAHDRETDKTHELEKNFLTKYLLNSVFKFANVIITQNNYQKKNLTNLKNKKSQILKSSFPLAKKNNIQEKKHILWVGRSKPFKQPFKFLKLAKNFPNEKFVMICATATGKEEQKIQNQIIKRTKEIKNLDFKGFVPFDKIDNYFKTAKVFVNTSSKEGFPNTFIQAGITKTPIISLNVNPNNILNKYKIGFCAKKNVNKMLTDLKFLLKNKSNYNKYSQNSFEYVNKNHNLELNSKKFFNIIKNL